jgi:four helix bundle protein
MTTPIESFQSRGFRFACEIVRLYVKLSRQPDFPMHLARQVLKAGTSVGANLEERRGAQTRRDIAAKFSVALKEAREALFWLRLFKATDLAPEQLLTPLLAEANELVAVLTTARRKLNESRQG